MLGSELQDRVNKLQTSVKAGVCTSISCLLLPCCFASLATYNAQKLRISNKALVKSHDRQHHPQSNGTVLPGEELQTQSIEKRAAEEQQRTAMILSVTELEVRVEELHVALTAGVRSAIHCCWPMSLA